MLPRQVQEGYILAVRFAYVSGGAVNVIPNLRWDFAGVTQVCSVPFVTVVPAGLNVVMGTWAVDAPSTFHTHASGNVNGSQRIPAMPLTPQMQAYIEFFDSDALDTCEEVSWLISDEPLRRSH
jgi:hypothetical protein